MHLAILNYPYDPDAPTAAAQLARYYTLTGWAEAVAATGARVTVVQRFHQDTELSRGGVRYLLVRDGAGPTPRGWQIPRRAHAMVAAATPDIVHFHGQIFPLQTMALRRALPRRAPLLVQHHAGDPPAATGLGPRLRRALLRLGLAAADGFIFTSAELAAPWRATGLIGPHQPIYEVIESSTPLAPANETAPGLPGAPALLWVGRLHPVKDPLTVLEGFARALPALPGAALSMAYGSEELLGQVRERCARPDLAGRVRLLGRLPHADLPAYYGAADLFVLGSRRESTGYALVEALACGLPPAVTDIPAFRAVTGGAVGAHWSPGDPDACAEAIVRVARGDRAAQRAAARARFAAALSWERVGQAASAAYAEMVSRPCMSR